MSASLKNLQFLCMFRKAEGRCHGGEVSTVLASYHQRTKHQYRRVKETGVQTGQRVIP